jgi:hypothetical protein
MLASDWYRERLRVKQERDVALWKRHIAALGDTSATAEARKQLERVSAPEYLEELVGTIGADPFEGQMGTTGKAPLLLVTASR